jgi:hypothetical protein
MEKKELYELARELDRKFMEEKLYCETYGDWDGRICYQIDWGDWKHEHLRADWIAREFFEARGFRVYITEATTEEDGSDTYSALHTVELLEIP